MRQRIWTTAAAVLVVGLLTACAPEDGGPLATRTPTPRPTATATATAIPTNTSVPPTATNVPAPQPTTPPAPVPTNPPAVPTTQPGIAPPSPATPVAPAAGCPELQTWREWLGVDITRVNTEPCAYTYNNGREAYVDTVNTPLNTQANIKTVDPVRGEIVVVMNGNGRACAQVAAATWRYLPLYPGLSEARGTDLLKLNAPSLGYSPDIVHQQTCPHQVDKIAYGAKPTSSGAPIAKPSQPAEQPNPLVPCPVISGIQTTKIEGGCLWQAGTARNLVVPEWAKAHYGIPARFVDGPTTIPGITDASIYNK